MLLSLSPAPLELLTMQRYDIFRNQQWLSPVLCAQTALLLMQVKECKPIVELITKQRAEA